MDIISVILQLESEAFGEGGLNYFNLVPFIRHGRVYIFKFNKEIIGAAQFMRDWDKPDKAYLVGISIKKAFQGKKLGDSFLNGCLRRIKYEKIQTVELTVDPQNIPAVKLYKKTGFVIQELRKDEYVKNIDRLMMIMNLNGQS